MASLLVGATIGIIKAIKGNNKKKREEQLYNNNNANAHNVGTVQFIPTHGVSDGYYIAAQTKTSCPSPSSSTYCQKKAERRAARHVRKAERRGASRKMMHREEGCGGAMRMALETPRITVQVPSVDGGHQARPRTVSSSDWESPAMVGSERQMVRMNHPDQQPPPYEYGESYQQKV